MLVNDALLQWNDRIVRYRYALRTHLCATLGDVAIADALRFTQLLGAVLDVERMHLERGDMNEKTRADEAVELLVIPQNVADILTEKAFDALSEFLNTVNVRLPHPPCAVGRIRRAGFELFDLFFLLEIPRDVGDEVAQRRKCAHWLDGPRLRQIEIA